MTAPAAARVSVGLPVYNGERYLAEALDSLLAQTYEDFELIICDNASTDRTGEIARTYAAKDKRVRYASNDVNLGVAGNYRRTFELSSGEYFRWAAVDDLCAPAALARCVEVLDREPEVVLAYPRTKLVDEEGRVIAEYEDGLHLASPRASERFAQLHARLRLCNAAYGVVRRDVLLRTALIGPYLASDGVLLAELTLYGRFWEIPEFLFFRRIHAGSQIELDRQECRDPDAGHGIPLTQWRHAWEKLRAVRRAPLSLRERMRVQAYLIRYGIWSRGELAGELRAAVRRQLRRLTTPGVPTRTC